MRLSIDQQIHKPRMPSRMHKTYKILWPKELQHPYSNVTEKIQLEQILVMTIKFGIIDH